MLRLDKNERITCQKWISEIGAGVCTLVEMTDPAC